MIMKIWEKKNKLIRALPKGQAIRYIFFLPYMAAKKRMPLLSLTQKQKHFFLLEVLLFLIQIELIQSRIPYLNKATYFHVIILHDKTKK